MPRLRLDVALTLLVLAALALAPLLGFGANHYLTLFARIMILAAAAVSLSFLVGGAGLASLGHAAAMGVGAYAVAILDAHRLTDITIVLPVALAAAALFSLLTGAIAIRTEGVNFIMITLAFGQMAFFTASSLAAYGGDDGYTLYDRTEIFGSRLMENRLFFHYLCLGFLVFCCWRPASGAYCARRGRIHCAPRRSASRLTRIGFWPMSLRERWRGLQAFCSPMPPNLSHLPT
jgi:branched-chain amino acid transport system permease protein